MKLDNYLNDENNQKVELIAISPIAYSLLREGEILRVELKAAKKNEYREKIGPAVEYYLVMKGVTKIGMIPTNFITRNPELSKVRKCQVLKFDQKKNIIEVTLNPRK
jgi:hypothetical protein